MRSFLKYAAAVTLAGALAVASRRAEPGALERPSSLA